MSVQGICAGSFVGTASVIGLSAVGSLGAYWVCDPLLPTTGDGKRSFDARQLNDRYRDGVADTPFRQRT